jgi:DNA-binding transcriptional ArsR family regulator
MVEYKLPHSDSRQPNSRQLDGQQLDGPQLDGVFQALSDSTRRRMLHSLSEQPRSVGELAAPFRISLAAASKHIKVLERAGLVRRQIQGRTHLCHLRAESLAASEQWLRHYQRFWEQRLDALDSALRADGSVDSSSETHAKGKKR